MGINPPLFPHVSPCHDMCFKQIRNSRYRELIIVNVFSNSKAFHEIIFQEKSFTIILPSVNPVSYLQICELFVCFLFRKCIMALNKQIPALFTELYTPGSVNTRHLLFAPQKFLCTSGENDIDLQGNSLVLGRVCMCNPTPTLDNLPVKRWHK